MGANRRKLRVPAHEPVQTRPIRRAEDPAYLPLSSEARERGERSGERHLPGWEFRHNKDPVAVAKHSGRRSVLTLSTFAAELHSLMPSQPSWGRTRPTPFLI